MSLFYKVELLLEVPDNICKNWDSQCDETFGIAKCLDYRPSISQGLLDYKELSREEYDILSKHKVFNESGGI